MLLLSVLGRAIREELLDVVADSLIFLFIAILVLLTFSCLIRAIMLCGKWLGFWCEDLVSLIKLQGMDALQVRLVEEAGHAVLKTDE